MLTFEGIHENFQFLVLETQNLVRAARDFVASPESRTYDAIASRDDYIDNLKTVVENKCYAELNSRKGMKREDVNYIRATQSIGVNLERIADHCINIIRQWTHLEDPAFLEQFDYRAAFDLIESKISSIDVVLRERDLSGALGICRAEHDLDEVYKEIFGEIMPRLQSGRNAQNLVTTLFIYRYLERIGDALLNIGEALLLAIVGERVKIHQFQALQQTLDKTGFQGSMNDVDYRSIWGTRSGCRIAQVGAGRGLEGRAQGSIFKEGNPRKIRAERESLNAWSERFPGIAPKVFSYHEDDDKASMLIEFLPGLSLDEIGISGEEGLVRAAVVRLEQTLVDIWTASREERPIQTDYIEQIRARLDHVQRVHPSFLRNKHYLGEAKIASSIELLDQCAAAERDLPAPFTVLIHGDSNANNIIYDEREDRIHFLDLHRSRQFDYVQDISVLIVSFARVPIFDTGVRQRLNAITEQLQRFARELAEEWNDPTYAARLAMALARSFYTSTRFELQHAFAKEMYLRAHFLLEKIAHYGRSGRPWKDFRLTEAVLFY